MFSQLINQKDTNEKFVITQKENAIYYAITNPKELKAVEVSEDLYRVKFYFSGIETEQGNESYEFTEERRRIRGIVSSAVNPPSVHFGNVATDYQCIEIFGMKDYTVMAACNRLHIEETESIAEQLHPLEWILTKARNSAVLPTELYNKIRIDVRHRATQLREVARTNKNSYRRVLDEVSKKYSPNADFKRITTSADTDKFAGQVVAYLSDSYYFSCGDNAITSPVEVSGNKVRFARVNRHTRVWQEKEGHYEIQAFYDMQVFLKPEACESSHALIDSKISNDSAFAMRLATAQELEFLKLTLELDQGRLRYKKKKEDTEMLAGKLAQHPICAPIKALDINELDISDVEMAQSTFGQKSNTAKHLAIFYKQKNEDTIMLAEKIAQTSDITNPQERNSLTPSQFSFFTPRTSAAVPRFAPFTRGVVDWTKESENKDKSEPPRPSGVYVITGGDEQSREEIVNSLKRKYSFAMCDKHYNKDKTECAVVFSCKHDTFNLMNFDKAKEFAGQQHIPNNFSTSAFRKVARFGVINLDDVSKSKAVDSNNSFAKLGVFAVGVVATELGFEAYRKFTNR